jgi:hypothetical protein
VLGAIISIFHSDQLQFFWYCVIVCYHKESINPSIIILKKTLLMRGREMTSSSLDLLGSLGGHYSAYFP